MSADYANDIPVALARAAHAGTSMVPEERAEQERAGYAATLTADFEALARIAGDDAAKRAILASEFARYRTGYRARSVARLSALSRCMSTMVTGPSNFPTRRNAKRNDSADKRTTELVEYRERALTAIRRELQPELRPIMAGDTDALERLRAELALLERLQTRMATANKVIRSNARRGAEAQIAALLELGIGGTSAAELIKPDYMGRVGFADYQLKNNGANIRRIRARLEQVTVAHATPESETVGELARLVDSPADNRVRLFFDGKPDAETRTRLKAGGFRWTPSLGCWQAYRNDRAFAIARREAGAP